MKYQIYILVDRQDDPVGNSKSWRLLKPHEMPKYRHSNNIPVHIVKTYDGFESFEAAKNWIDQFGERFQEYTILPVIKPA